MLIINIFLGSYGDYFFSGMENFDFCFQIYLLFGYVLQFDKYMYVPVYNVYILVGFDLVGIKCWRCFKNLPVAKSQLI